MQSRSTGGTLSKIHFYTDLHQASSGLKSLATAAWFYCSLCSYTVFFVRILFPLPIYVYTVFPLFLYSVTLFLIVSIPILIPRLICSLCSYCSFCMFLLFLRFLYIAIIIVFSPIRLYSSYSDPSVPSVPTVPTWSVLRFLIQWRRKQFFNGGALVF